MNEINNYEINHTCSTDYGSSGSPILNLEDNTVIGIHKEASPYNFNKGTFLKFPINDFNAKIEKEKEKKNWKTKSYRILEAEYNNYWKENKDDCFIVSPIDESNIYTWSIKFKGPKDSPYEGGIFHLKVDFLMIILLNIFKSSLLLQFFILMLIQIMARFVLVA